MSAAKKRLLVILVVVALLAGIAAMIGLSAPSAAEDSESASTKPLVEVQTLSSGNITVQGEYIGTVDPQQVNVIPKVSGEVLAVHVNVGDVVEAGDVLCEVDSQALQSQIAQTQAALSSAENRAQYNLAVAEKELATHDFNVEKGYDSSLINAEAAVRQAENSVANAELNLRTAQRQLDDHLDEDEYSFVSLQGLTYDETTDSLRDVVTQAQIGLESARLGLEQAEETLRSVKMLTEERGISVSEQVEIARMATDFSDQHIALAQMQDNLQDYTIRAAIGGVVEQRNIDPYDMASPQSPIFVITNQELLSVSFGIPETGLEHLQMGDKVIIDRNGQTCEAEITEISTMVNAQNGLFTVKAAVENPPFSLHNGSTVKIIADIQKAQDALILPIDALYYENGEPYVFVAQEGRAVKTFVQTGISDETQVEITGGLSGGEQVVVTWHSALADGVELEIAADSATDNASASEEAAH